MNEKCLICEKCGKVLSSGKNRKTNFCLKCRDRTGVNNPFYGKIHNKETMDLIKRKSSETMKEKWKDPKYRQLVKKTTTGLKRTGEFKETQRINAIRQFKDPEQRLLRSVRMSKSWEQGSIAQNFPSNPSKKEMNLFEELVKLTERKIERGKTIRFKNGYYFPDIVVCDKLIIEFNGDYWHANPTKFNPDDIVHHNIKAKNIWDKDMKRIRNIESLGYKVFIVWESDYNNDKKLLLEKIKKLIDGI